MEKKIAKEYIDSILNAYQTSDELGESPSYRKVWLSFKDIEALNLAKSLLESHDLHIMACMYAISELKRKGSCSFITSTSDGARVITWDEVLDWLLSQKEVK